MRVNLLGPLEMAGGDGVAFAPRTPKLCQVLALLALRAGEVVSTDVLVRELWGDVPPKSALTTLQTYVYHARKIFAERSLLAPGREALVTRRPGYALLLDPDEVDVKAFERSVAQARALLDEGSDEQAIAVVRAGLALWRGAALADVTRGPVLDGAVEALDELRLHAIELNVEATERLGRYREVIPTLRSLVFTQPLNEWAHARLINALGRCGRRAEALQAYHHLRRTLDEALGLEPGPDVQRLHMEVLNSHQFGGATRENLAFV